ncbi:MAG TPA: hypothetical protein VK871_09340 [Candidatus Limnocylindrales bacterium]|nr:hypothetical protein [Candidatus Limnocylindrales bacterium]
MIDARRSLHLAVFVGASAGLYAGSLACVAALQAASDRAVALERAPTEAAIVDLGAANDELEATVDRILASYEAAGERYDATVPRIADAEARLQDLAATVAEIEGAAANLPSRVSLPAVRAAAPRAAAPTVHATTSASGG